MTIFVCVVCGGDAACNAETPCPFCGGLVCSNACAANHCVQHFGHEDAARIIGSADDEDLPSRMEEDKN